MKIDGNASIWSLSIKHFLKELYLYSFTFKILIMSKLSLATYLVTGSTDGIGLFTVKSLVSWALQKQFEKVVIGLHGRCPERIRNSVSTIDALIPQDMKNCIEIVTFCYDLSDLEQVKMFVSDIIKKFTFGSYGFKLDVLINNAAIFDSIGPRKNADGRFELTFAVNVIAPFVITYQILQHAFQCKHFVKKVINTSSISHTDCYHHLQKLDYNNLQFENDLKWTSFNSYGLSKQLVIMFTRGFFHDQKWNERILDNTCMINMDPGTVNTKMLLAGWGECGIPVDQAKDTFHLAVEDKFFQPKSEPKYYDHLRERNPAEICCNEKECVDFFKYLVNLCELE